MNENIYLPYSMHTDTHNHGENRSSISTTAIGRLKKTVIKLVSIFSLAATFAPCQANELHTSTYNFPNPEALAVGQGSLLIRCQANPDRCPAGLSYSSGNSSNSHSRSLFDPSATSSANNTSIVIAGDRNDLIFTSEQIADDSSINSAVESDANIESSEILNYGVQGDAIQSQ